MSLRSAPLLRAKLAAPVPRENALPRPRLVARLAHGAGGALTLVTGPAGYGKSALLAEWLGKARAHVRTAYLALDDDDDAPESFMPYLAAALARLAPGPDASPPADASAAWKPWLAGCLNQLAALHTPLALVLDNYQCIRSPAIHAALSYLLDYLPAPLHVVLATRTVPERLPLDRLRASGLLCELRAAELAFDAQESEAFLCGLGLGLAPGEREALHRLTEGWPAGLQLAALALRERPAGQDALAALSAGRRYICEYLSSEVLARQPRPIQRFMQQCALLDELSGPLCDALSGGSGGARILGELERANLFVQPLAGRPGWYRFHPLMSSSLRERLARHSTATALRALHRRASRRHEQDGDLAQAIRQALAAGDTARAAALVDRAAEPAMRRGEVAVILAWLDALPRSAVRARPGLCVWYAWALCLTERWQAAEPWLRAAESVLRRRLARGTGACDVPSAAERCRSKLGEVSAVRALAARLEGDLARSASEAQSARAALLASDLVVRSAVAHTLGAVYAESGQYAEGARSLAEAERSSLTAGHPYLYVSSLVQRARLYARQRRVSEAIALYRQARAHAERESLAALSAKICAELEAVLGAQRVLLDPLSARELEVLRLVAAGRSTAEVAAALCISAGTVRNHLKSIYTKLGAHTRFHAVERARALNVV